ncbi:hypothetical protein Y032_0009g607 [Ancylostoma ceylanicum]|uniref:Uncharacterized protein n=1 Tax=Ancylostoma ceylanicum TaxID=53326 RepID=A0A016VI02_9BILA|nr:hypothetical protein Y032_0009g607 [Ancylostoma ceylanicum]
MTDNNCLLLTVKILPSSRHEGFPDLDTVTNKVEAGLRLVSSRHEGFPDSDHSYASTLTILTNETNLDLSIQGLLCERCGRGCLRCSYLHNRYLRQSNNRQGYLHKCYHKHDLAVYKYLS